LQSISEHSTLHARQFKERWTILYIRLGTLGSRFSILRCSVINNVMTNTLYIYLCSATFLTACSWHCSNQQIFVSLCGTLDMLLSLSVMWFIQCPLLEQPAIQPPINALHNVSTKEASSFLFITFVWLFWFLQFFCTTVANSMIKFNYLTLWWCNYYCNSMT